MRRTAFLVAAALVAFVTTADASVGLTEIPGKNGDGVVTVFYPSGGEEQSVQRGPFTFHLALQGTPVRGNGRLIVISHGSGGSPWVHADLARTLVEDGFVWPCLCTGGTTITTPARPAP